MKILTIASIICIFLTSRWLIRGSHGATPIINALNVKCDETGMKVNIDFDSPFSGIIFSKGHYSSKDCRYVNGDTLDRSIGIKSFYFVIPAPGKCGTTSPSSVINNFIQFQNTIIIQADSLIQRSSDSIKKITCNWKPNIEKNVSMSTVNVASDINDVEEVIFTDDSGSRVETWMDLTDGEGNPFGKSITNAVAVGSKLTLAIYIKDSTGDFDLKVKDCFAYEEQEDIGYIRKAPSNVNRFNNNSNDQLRTGNEQFNSPTLKLTQDGCSLKKELIDDFTKLTSNSLRRLQAQMLANSPPSANRNHNLNSNSKLYEATAIAYSTLSVFKFPERTSLSFSCNIQLCKFKCSEMCSGKSTRRPSESTGQLSPLIASSSSSSSSSSSLVTSTTSSVDSTGGTNGPLKTKELTSGQLTSNKSNLTNQKSKNNLNDRNKLLSEFKDVPNDSPMVSLLPLVLNHTIYYTKSLEFDSNREDIQVKRNTVLNGTRLKRQMNINSKLLVNGMDIDKGHRVTSDQEDNKNIRATSEEGDVSVKRTLKVIAPNFDEPDVISSLFQSFVTGHSNQTKYQFKIPIKGCGTSRVNIDIEEESIDIKGFENIIVIQNNPAYQAINDSVRMIVCRYTAAIMDGPSARQSMDKRIVFKPFTVDMLDVINVPMSGPKEKHHSVSCWMDITRGVFPHARPIEGPVKVGENLTMAIYIKDKKETTDLRVKDCYAYDSREDAIGGGKPVIQLTSEQGCPLNNKLIGHWKTTTSTGTSGASVLAYATVSAFKFPEKENVFLSCNVELCTNGCLTFCNEETSHLSPNFSLDHRDNSSNSSPFPSSFTSSSLPPSSVLTTVTTTVTTPSSLPSHEVEFDLIDTRKPNRVAPQSIRRVPSPSNSDRVEHETNDDSDIAEVDVLSEESPSVRNVETMDLARLLFQGEVTTPPPSTDAPSTSSDEMATTPPTDGTSAATTTPSGDMASSTSNAETTMADGSATTPSTDSAEARTESEATTTPASSDDKGNSTETTAAIMSTTESTDQVKDAANATSDADGRARALKGGSVASDEESKGKSNEATPLIQMGGIKGGIKGVKGKNKIASPAAQLRKFPAFIPRRKPSSPVNGRSRSQSSSSSRRRSNRRSNSNSRTNRRARHQSSSGTISNNNNNRPQRRSSSGSSGAESRNSWRMEPLPAKFDTGLADVPFRSTSRRLRSRPGPSPVVGIVAK